jgi:AcrR family transcriptional regulator
MRPKSKKAVRGEGTTRQSILDAAVRHFASAAYGDVGLREIAADVGVDVAYVHRSFGSKEHLFQEVLKLPGRHEGLSAVAADDLAATLSRMLFDRTQLRDGYDTDPLLVLVRSLSSPTAGRLVGERLQSEFIEPIGKTLGDPTQVRAAMVMALMIGFSIMRNLLELPTVAETDPARMEATVANAITAIMELKDVADPGQR